MTMTGDASSLLDRNISGDAVRPSRRRRHQYKHSVRQPCSEGARELHISGTAGE